MRILFLTRTYPPESGAVGHLLRELGEALQAKGHQVTVVAGGLGDDERDIECGKLRVVRVGALPFSRQSHFKRALSYLSLYPAMLWAAVREQRPDLIVTTTDPPLQAVIGVFLKFRFRCKLLHWCQDLYPEMAEEAGVLRKDSPAAKGLRHISTAALRQHDRIISIGRCMTGRLINRGLEQGRIVEVANWTHSSSDVLLDPSASQFAQREGLAGKFLVEYSGNLGMAHCFEEIVEAAVTLQTVVPDVVFVIIGKGPRRKAFEEEVAKLRLENVRFFPPQPWRDFPDSMAAGHLHLVTLRATMSGLVVPSKFYGIMAAGRPCLFIGPKDSEVARVIMEREAGRVIGNGDAVALTQTILQYRNSRDLWEEDSRRARNFGDSASLDSATQKLHAIASQM